MQQLKTGPEMRYPALILGVLLSHLVSAEATEVFLKARDQTVANWAEEDTYQQMFDELTALAQAGFARPEVYWREGPFAVYGGIRV